MVIIWKLQKKTSLKIGCIWNGEMTVVRLLIISREHKKGLVILDTLFRGHA